MPELLWVLLIPSWPNPHPRKWIQLWRGLFFSPMSLHLDWHLTEACSPVPFISSLKEMINMARQCSSISLDRSTGVFIKPILMSWIHSCGQVILEKEKNEEGRKKRKRKHTHTKTQREKYPTTSVNCSLEINRKSGPFPC